MIPENFKHLAARLIEKTVNRQAIWGKTSRENEYIISLEKGAITVDRWTSNDSQVYVDMAIYNDRGDKIDSVIFGAFEEEFKVINELHEAAKKAYYKVDETFIEILKELDNDKPIGSGPKV